MARVGSFDQDLSNLAWFDETGVVEGWFDDDLIGAPTTSNSQALAITLDGVTVAINQTAGHPQSLAITLDDVTALITQSVAGAAKSQALAITLDDVSVAIQQTGPASVIDTHDGWWADQWRKKHKKKPLPDTAEEAQALVIEIIAKAKKNSIRLPSAIVLPDNTAQQIAIAETLIDKLRSMQDEDDIEALLLML